MKDMLDIVIGLYGPRLTTSDLAHALKITPGEVRNQISAGTCPIETYKEKPGKRAPRYADARDVAEYLDRMRPKPKASVQASQDRGGYSA